MQQLHYADEIKSFDEVERIDATLQEAELELAEQLIGQIAAERFDPAPYHDGVKERLEAAIARKVEGEEAIAAAPSEAPQARVIDLMEALRASLAETEPGADAKGAEAKRRGPKRAAGASAKTRAPSAGKAKHSGKPKAGR